MKKRFKKKPTIIDSADPSDSSIDRMVEEMTPEVRNVQLIENNPKSRDRNLVIQETGDELLIYDLRKNRAYCLNETSAMVWRMCDGRHSLSEISEKIDDIQGTRSKKAIVQLAIEQLRENDLLAENSRNSNENSGHNRRELMRIVGLAATTALPIVSTIVAPEVAHAQSCVNPGGLPPGTPLNFSTANPVPCSDAACNSTPSITSACCSGTARIEPAGSPPRLDAQCECACL